MNCQWCNTSIDSRTPTNLSLIENGPLIPALCIECWKKAAVCDTCFGVHKYPEDISYTGEGYLYMCHGCAGGLATCEGCGKDRPNLTDVGGRELCRECASHHTFCDGCGMFHDSREIPFVNDDKVLQLQYPTYWKRVRAAKKKVCTPHFRSLIPSRIMPKRVFTCLSCGDSSNTHCEKDGVTLDYCHLCASQLQKCEDCGNWITNSRTYGTHEGSIRLCFPCRDTRWSNCAACGNKYKTHEGTDGQCKHCYGLVFECTRCHNWHRKGTEMMVGTSTVCSECFTRCPTCSTCQTKMVKSYNGSSCRACSLAAGYGRIDNYSTKPKVIFHGKGALHYGFENEVSMRDGADLNRCAASILRNFEEEDIIIKHDSSVDNGFEVVSQPFTYKGYQDERWHKLFIPEIRAHSSCGMHVHVNIASFTSFHMYKFLFFINQHPTMISKISERTPNSYCKLHDGKAEKDVLKYKKEGLSTDRYRRVNIGKHTMELRCFASAITYEMWKKNIEFVDALFNYTLITSKLEINPKTFKLYVVKNQKEYPFLFAFFKKIYTLPEM